MNELIRQRAKALIEQHSVEVPRTIKTSYVVVLIAAAFCAGIMFVPYYISPTQGVVSCSN